MGDINNIEKLVQTIFSYEFRGGNCLFAATHMMREYSAQTNQMPDSSIGMFNDYESLFIYLLQLAERNNVDIDRVINHTTDAGSSLLHHSTLYSEKISLELINRNVKVNRIDNRFVTPRFLVRIFLIFNFKSFI